MWTSGRPDRYSGSPYAEEATYGEHDQGHHDFVLHRHFLRPAVASNQGRSFLLAPFFPSSPLSAPNWCLRTSCMLVEAAPSLSTVRPCGPPWSSLGRRRLALCFRQGMAFTWPPLVISSLACAAHPVLEHCFAPPVPGVGSAGRAALCVQLVLVARVTFGCCSLPAGQVIRAS